jgi:hypothetical protein
MRGIPSSCSLPGREVRGCAIADPAGHCSRRPATPGRVQRQDAGDLRRGGRNARVYAVGGSAGPTSAQYAAHRHRGPLLPYRCRRLPQCACRIGYRLYPSDRYRMSATWSEFVASTSRWRAHSRKACAPPWRESPLTKILEWAMRDSNPDILRVKQAAGPIIFCRNVL